MYLTHSNLYTAWRDNDDYTIFMIVLLNWRAKRRAKKIRKYFIHKIVLKKYHEEVGQKSRTHLLNFVRLLR